MSPVLLLYRSVTVPCPGCSWTGSSPSTCWCRSWCWPALAPVSTSWSQGFRTHTSGATRLWSTVRWWWAWTAKTKMAMPSYDMTSHYGKDRSWPYGVGLGLEDRRMVDRDRHPLRGLGRERPDWEETALRGRHCGQVVSPFETWNNVFIERGKQKMRSFEQRDSSCFHVHICAISWLCQFLHIFCNQTFTAFLMMFMYLSAFEAD